jgi:hypothetical protein
VDEFNLNGDIFNDFNEDIEATKVLEDERFYRYGRFFSFELSFGLTTFDGNRGTAYENEPPTYGIGLHYFLNFNTSIGLGFSSSKHHFFLDEPTVGFDPNGPGFVSVNTLRFWLSLRHYIDTSNLGTAITYSNPYLVGRMEYWYVTNKYLDQDVSIVPNDAGGGFGFAGGFGLEFPIVLKEYYLGFEFLAHIINFHDKFTQRYRPIEGNTNGFEDLSGNAFSMIVSFTQTW